MTVHFERAGKPFAMLLDLVEVAESHTGVNLGTAFANVLKKFGIEERVRVLNDYQKRPLTSATHITDPWDNGGQRVQQRHHDQISW